MRMLSGYVYKICQCGRQALLKRCSGKTFPWKLAVVNIIHTVWKERKVRRARARTHTPLAFVRWYADLLLCARRSESCILLFSLVCQTRGSIHIRTRTSARAPAHVIFVVIQNIVGNYSLTLLSQTKLWLIFIISVRVHKSEVWISAAVFVSFV